MTESDLIVMQKCICISSYIKGSVLKSLYIEIKRSEKR